MSQENGEWLAPQLGCMFCEKVTTVESASNNGWVPSFWHDGSEHGKPGTGICPNCVATHLKFNEEFGDYELLPDHPLPNR